MRMASISRRGPLPLSLWIRRREKLTASISIKPVKSEARNPCRRRKRLAQAGETRNNSNNQIHSNLPALLNTVGPFRFDG